MTTVNKNRAREIKGAIPEKEVEGIKPESIEGVSREDVINKLIEQKLKLNAVINKGLTNADVERYRANLEKLGSELDELIKRLEVA